MSILDQAGFATYELHDNCRNTREVATQGSIISGIDVAIESAGVVLASDDPRGVVSVRRLSEASYRKMVQNLGWALGYNVLAIPLAAGVLAWAGVAFPPAVGAVAMSLSTIVVAFNALLLRDVDLGPRGSRREDADERPPANGDADPRLVLTGRRPHHRNDPSPSEDA